MATHDVTAPIFVSTFKATVCSLKYFYLKLNHSASNESHLLIDYQWLFQAYNYFLDHCP